MSDHTRREKTTFSEKLNAFFGRYRIHLSVVAIVLIVGIVASVILAQWLNARAERSAAAAERVESLWEEWTAEQPLPTDDAADDAPTAAAQEIETELRTLIADTTDSFGGTYGATRANLILGLLEWDLGNYDAARSVFEEIADRQEGTYLEPIALSNAASASEASGDLETAIALYTRIVDLEGTPNLERPHALFSLGRLSEQTESFDEAYDYYTQLVDEHEAGNWTNLGRTRIIWLTSQGLVGAEN